MTIIDIGRWHTGRHIVASSFGIHEDRQDDRSEIASHARSVVVEDSGNTTNVGWRRIGGDQLLNQLLADEGPNVRMFEDVVERENEIFLCVLTRRADYPVQ